LSRPWGFVFTKGVAFSEGGGERVIVFVGAPGSGKGTQSSRLAKRFAIPVISTGEMLRGESRRDTPEGRRLRRILAAGSLVDDAVVCAAVNARLRRDLPGGGMILDGFPRNLNQAARLDGILRGMGKAGPLVLHLQASRRCLIDRLTSRRQCESCGTVYNLALRPSRLDTHCENDGGLLVSREDDADAVIGRRLDEFDRACAPLVDFYRNGDYHLIDGDQDAEVVSAALLAIVGMSAARVAA
jgi:adenylate kinase